MIFIEALIVSILFVLSCGKKLQKKPISFYIVSAILALITAVLNIVGIHFTGIFGAYIYPIFDKAALGTALFVLVMYAGAMPVKSKTVKTLMPIRGQLSILAGIFTLGHNIGYGKTYFVRLFTDSGLTVTTRLAGICSICMLVIMIPLWLTSFITIRRKMKPKNWKKLQRFAYGFYGLLYLHIMLLEVPFAMNGISRCAINVGVYTTIFSGYLIIRIFRYLEKKYRNSDYTSVRAKFASVAVILGIAVALITLPNTKTFLHRLTSRVSNSETDTESSSTDSSAGSINDSSTSGSTSNEDLMTDGTYIGTAFGYEGDITVALTIKDGMVVDGEITDYSDDPDYQNMAEKMLKNFLGNPDGEVDVISGATFTSKGVLAACEDAMNQAENTDK